MTTFAALEHRLARIERHQTTNEGIWSSRPPVLTTDKARAVINALAEMRFFESIDATNPLWQLRELVVGDDRPVEGENDEGRGEERKGGAHESPCDDHTSDPG